VLLVLVIGLVDRFDARFEIRDSRVFLELVKLPVQPIPRLEKSALGGRDGWKLVPVVIEPGLLSIDGLEKAPNASPVSSAQARRD